MNTVATVVKATSFEIGLEGNRLNKPCMVIFGIVNKIHRVWRCIEKAKVYANPNNFLGLVGGHALNAFLGDRVLVRISAISVLIAYRITLIIEQIHRLQESFRKMYGTLKNEYPKVYHYHKNKIKFFFIKLLERIKRFVVNLFTFLKEIFILSMRVMDAIEMFYLSPETRNEGINEMFVNLTQLLDKMVENRSGLENSIGKCKPIIQKVLKGIGSSFTAEQFIEFSKKTFDNITQVQRTTRGASNFVGEVVTEVFIRSVFGVASMVGLEGMLPQKLQPNYHIQPRVIKPELRYAPTRLITIQN